MKKTIKLKRWVKVVLTIVLLIASSVIYSNVGSLGELAQTHRSYQLICIGAWFWLLCGQVLVLTSVWEA